MSPVRKQFSRIAAVLGALGLIAAILGYRFLEPQAYVGAGVVAHQICSCVFVSERSLESCRPDLMPEVAAIPAEIVEQNGQSGVRARVPLLARRIALHTPGRGCALD